MNKRDLAVTFLKSAASGNVKEAYDKYVHPEFQHHNPYFKGDRKSLMRGMEENELEFPGKVYRFFQAIEEGDRVVVHGSVRLRNDLPEIALIHIFRFEGDLIIEEWEASQEVPVEMPNENGMF